MTPSLRPRTPQNICYSFTRKKNWKSKKLSSLSVTLKPRSQDAPAEVTEKSVKETPVTPATVEERPARKVKITFGTKNKRQCVELEPKLPSPTSPPAKRIKITIKPYPPRENKAEAAKKTQTPPAENSKEVQVSNIEQYKLVPTTQSNNIMSRRVLNSEAYLHYIENLRSGSRKVTLWDKSLNSGLPYKQHRRAYKKKKSEEAIDYIRKDSEGKNVVSENAVAQALWKMRDQLLRSCLGMDVPATDYSAYAVPKDNTKEYPPNLPL